VIHIYHSDFALDKLYKKRILKVDDGLLSATVTHISGFDNPDLRAEDY